MRKSVFRSGLFVIYALFVGVFAWIIYVQPHEWWKVVIALLLFTPVYFWCVRVRCEYYEMVGGFAPERETVAKRGE